MLSHYSKPQFGFTILMSWYYFHLLSVCFGKALVSSVCLSIHRAPPLRLDTGGRCQSAIAARPAAHSLLIIVA